MFTILGKSATPWFSLSTKNTFWGDCRMIERDLTRAEKAAVRDLILGSPGCANCDRQTGECLPLEVRCPMLDLQFNGATLCTYFKAAVLPENPELEAIFTGRGTDLKVCPICHKKFKPAANRQKYCPTCRDEARKTKSARRNQKYRLKP
jgi:hypothetical protein